MQNPFARSAQAVQQHAWFLVIWLASLCVFAVPVRALINLSLADDRYSHILLIPCISAGLLYLERKSVFHGSRFSFSKGGVLGLIALGAALCSSVWLSRDLGLSVTALAIVCFWMAAFLACYGTRSFYTALFPLLFLLFIVPVPGAVVDYMISALQIGSAQVTYALFRILGVPVYWHGLLFSLPGVTIEIAKECSGIHSSIALLITSLVAGHLFLRSAPRTLLLSLSTIPVTIFKNAARIVTISWLGVYVDPGFLVGKLHRYGGLPFSLLALALLAPVLVALQRSEKAALRQVSAAPQDEIGQDWATGFSIWRSRTGQSKSLAPPFFRRRNSLSANQSRTSGHQRRVEESGSMPEPRPGTAK